MVGTDYVPARGEIVWLRFTPRSGREQSGHRPALVLSPEAYNERTGLALFCQITSVVKGYPFAVALPPASAITGVVLADQVKSLDWRARRAQFACQATAHVVSEVLGKANALLQ